MQALQPVHLLGSTSTILLPFQWWLAPVGHMYTQVACEQWLQRSERNSVFRFG